MKKAPKTPQKVQKSAPKQFNCWFSNILKDPAFLFYQIPHKASKITLPTEPSFWGFYQTPEKKWPCLEPVLGTKLFSQSMPKSF